MVPEEEMKLTPAPRYDDVYLEAMKLIDEPEVRKAQCTYCKEIIEVNEKTRRQFIITPRPEWEMDSMYDGCRGWD